MKHLNLTGCFKINNLIVAKSMQADQKLNDTSVPSTNQKLSTEHELMLFKPNDSYLYLQYIDLSYCTNITDVCILNVCKSCIYVRNFYLKKCQLLTDFSLLYVTKYCWYLRELSVSQCNRITDEGIVTFELDLIDHISSF